MKIVKFTIGFILAVGIALGVAMGLVWLIPIRGTGLAMIISPISALVGLVGVYYAGVWALGGKG